MASRGGTARIGRRWAAASPVAAWRTYRRLNPTGRTFISRDIYVGRGSERDEHRRWNGSAWSALGTGLNGPVRALLYKTNALYVGGSFTNLLGGLNLTNLAAWDGSAWSAWSGPIGPFVNWFPKGRTFTLAEISPSWEA